MKIPHNALIAIADGERFFLMRNTGQIFEPKLEQVDEPDLDPSNFSAGVKHQDDGGQKTGSTQLDELAHGAAVAEWLNSKAISGTLGEVVIVADPKTLGEMRRHYHSELEKQIVGEVDKTVTGESAEKIAKILASA